MRFKKIGLAIAFSPRAEAMLAEAVRIKILFDSELVLIHVGQHGAAEDNQLSQLLERQKLNPDEVTIIWREGKPSKEILKVCKEAGIDLLITGALKKEGLVQHYVGSVARRILRKSDCSVLTLVRPAVNPQPFSNVVVDAQENDLMKETLSMACWIGVQEKAKWLHVVREIKLYGLTMSSAEQSTEEEYNQLRNNLVQEEVDNVHVLLSRTPHHGLKVNIKILSGKSGFEIAEFSRTKQADLLVVSAPPSRLSLLDRLFPHDLEFIFADLPCNLLVVHPRKEREGKHG
jgi:nucleotide-binding universal stress UspA family protein